VRRLVVSSPGVGPDPHWSHAEAAAIAAALAALGEDVLWYAVLRPGQRLPSPPTGCELRASPVRAVPPLHRVADDSADALFEQLLQRSLREQPAATVLHVGAGARGSPNVGWLADRMGSSAFAVVRAAEVVCHRGDLVDHRGSACSNFLAPDHCRRCCTGGWLRRPPAAAFANRADLLAGSLLAARAVFVTSAADVGPLVAFGLPERSVVVADATAIAAAVLAPGSAR
jgi:hypothetical protein